jgi:hypothetical protein
MDDKAIFIMDLSTLPLENLFLAIYDNEQAKKNLKFVTVMTPSEHIGTLYKIYRTNTLIEQEFQQLMNHYSVPKEQCPDIYKHILQHLPKY